MIHPTDGPDEAAIYGREGKPVAAYRDPDGELHTQSAVCPHLGCVVDFNPVERSWDCPVTARGFTPTARSSTVQPFRDCRRSTI
jgi:Rieske Fe-S protein